MVSRDQSSAGCVGISLQAVLHSVCRVESYPVGFHAFLPGRNVAEEGRIEVIRTGNDLTKIKGRR